MKDYGCAQYLTMKWQENGSKFVKHIHVRKWALKLRLRLETIWYINITDYYML